MDIRGNVRTLGQRNRFPLANRRGPLALFNAFRLTMEVTGRRTHSFRPFDGQTQYGPPEARGKIGGPVPRR
jgi:hypothetical protein